MNRKDYETAISDHREAIGQIRQSAFDLHASVGQTYDKTLPYSHHLQMVAEGVARYGYATCATADDVVPLMFAAYYHDSIEDARLTYNDVMRTARKYMDEPHALMATEIVYALTNDKGRTRAERAGDRYYQGIRTTPYAPMVKLADRLANMTYSSQNTNEANRRMRKVYSDEWPHFIGQITVKNDDLRLSLPAEMIEAVTALLR